MITKVPGELSIKISNAQLLTNTVPATMDIRSREAVLETRTSPVRFEMQNRAFFDSLGLKSPQSMLRDDIQKSDEAVLRSIGDCARDASSMGGPQKITVADLTRMHFLQTLGGTVEMIPIAPPEISWEGGEVDCSYQPGEFQIKWDTGGVRKRYVPYSVEVAVAEWKSIPKEIDSTEE